MSDFEQRVRAALERQDPSEDFASKVMARAKAIDDRRRSSWKPWAAGCVAASVLLASWGAGAEFQKQRERERGQMAHAQLIHALGITSSKLQRIHKKLDELNHE